MRPQATVPRRYTQHRREELVSLEHRRQQQIASQRRELLVEMRPLLAHVVAERPQIEPAILHRDNTDITPCHRSRQYSTHIAVSLRQSHKIAHLHVSAVDIKAQLSIDRQRQLVFEIFILEVHFLCLGDMDGDDFVSVVLAEIVAGLPFVNARTDIQGAENERNSLFRFKICLAN